MTYNLPLHPICKYSCNCRSYEYLQSDFSTNHLHCGWPLRDVIKIEYAGSSTTPGPKCRQSLPIQAFQQVELVVGAEIIDIPPFGIPSNPTEQRGARFNTIHAIYTMMLHTCSTLRRQTLATERSRSLPSPSSTLPGRIGRFRPR